MLEKQVKPPGSYVGRITESVVSTNEEGKLNTPVPSTHTNYYYYYSPPSLSQVSNMDADISPVLDNYGIESNNCGSTEMVEWYEGGKGPSSSVGSIEERPLLKVLH